MALAPRPRRGPSGSHSFAGQGADGRRLILAHQAAVPVDINAEVGRKRRFDAVRCHVDACFTPIH